MKFKRVKKKVKEIFFWDVEKKNCLQFLISVDKEWKFIFLENNGKIYAKRIENLFGT